MLGVRLLEARLAVAEALDLGAGQDDPRLDLLEQVELEPGAAVPGDDLDSAVVGLGRFRFAAVFLRHGDHRRFRIATS